MKKRPRGDFEFQTDQNSGLHLVRWIDSKCVTLGSTYAGVEANRTVKRWDKKANKELTVQCPDIIKQYNESMGGVDLHDMIIALYRTEFRTKRWYLKILFHLLDICKVNGWLLYRCHCVQPHPQTKATTSAEIYN